MPRRLVPLATSLALLAPALAACMDDRDRLTPPTLVAEVGDSVTRPGGDIVVTLTATDPNGILYISARLRCAETDSLLRVQSDGSVPRLDSITDVFALAVPASVPANTRLVVEGATIDDQNFTVYTRDTVYARVSGVPRDQPPTDARCDTGVRP